MKVSDLIGPIPSSCRGKYQAHFRNQEDFAHMYPNLSPTELFSLTEQVSNTHPTTYQRKQVIEYFSNLNYSRSPF